MKTPTWIEIRDPATHKLLFKFDPERDLVQIKRGRLCTIVALAAYRSHPPTAPPPLDSDESPMLQ